MSKIYVPNFKECSCVTIKSNDIIRCYLEEPSPNISVEYKDYYINNHYIYDEFVESFDELSTSVNCVNESRLTDNHMYRNDIVSIYALFIMLSGIVFLIVKSLLKRLFKGGSLL